MTRKMQLEEKTEPVIRDTSDTESRVDPDELAAALGAEPCEQRLAARLGPISLMAVRQELIRRLQSTGGRPALEGTSRRVKIPVSDEQWKKLEELAADVSESGFAPSAGQVASVLLSLSLESVKVKRGGANAKVNSSQSD